MAVEDKRTAMEKLVGSNLLKAVNTKKKTAETMKGKELVLLYFSASWCPPCKAFSPVLIEFYNKFAAKENFEIIFVSSDKSVDSFNNYYKMMPWLAMPTDRGVAELKNRLAEQLKISAIPTLVVLDVKTGKFVTDNARNDVANAAGDDGKGMAVIKAWKSTEPVHLEQAVSTRQEPRTVMGTIMTWVFFILRNPVYIFALLYIYKTYIKNSPFNPIYVDEEKEEDVAAANPDQEF